MATDQGNRLTFVPNVIVHRASKQPLSNVAAVASSRRWASIRIRGTASIHGCSVSGFPQPCTQRSQSTRRIMSDFAQYDGVSVGSCDQCRRLAASAIRS